MHILSVLAIVLLSVCSTLATYVDLTDFTDGTYAYAKYWQVADEPSARDQGAYAKAGYDEMVAHGESKGIDTPSTMSAAYWPNANGRGGTMILHSSIVGGRDSEATRGYINACNIGGHRYRGMCGEVANMTWGKSLKDQGIIDTNSRVRWAVYGITNKRTGETDWMGPCGSQDGRNGCQAYVDRLARDSGGGGTCIRKREPVVVAPVKPLVPVKPKPPVVNDKDPAAPNDSPDHLVPGDKTPDEPTTPNDSPDRLTGDKDPANPNGDKNPDDPAVVGDKADEANKKKEFEDGAVCSLPARKTGPPAEIPDMTGLANFAPPPDKNPAVMRIRQVGWSYKF